MSDSLPHRLHENPWNGKRRLVIIIIVNLQKAGRAEPCVLAALVLGARLAFRADPTEPLPKRGVFVGVVL